MFWDNYLFLCNSVGKSPNAVAAEIGIKSSGTVTGWSKGSVPRKSILFKLSEYFKIGMDDLLSDSLQMNAVTPEQSTRGMTEEQREAYYRDLHKKEPPEMIGGLTEEDMEILKRFRNASPKKKEAIRMLLEE
nr:MAG TPA: SOS-response transcriptional repressor [Caudoviricetes sp.]